MPASGCTCTAFAVVEQHSGIADAAFHTIHNLVKWLHYANVDVQAG